MEEDEDVVEGCTEFVGEDSKFKGVVVYHWEHIFFEDRQTFTCEPYNVMVELEGFCVSCGVQST